MAMRPLGWLGLVLILLGGYVLVRGLSYTSKRDVLKMGSLEATVEEQHTIPTWVGGVAAVAGVALVFAGVRRA
jgi:hypothetical protein